jgi:hypothetical protein
MQNLNIVSSLPSPAFAMTLFFFSRKNVVSSSGSQPLERVQVPEFMMLLNAMFKTVIVRKFVIEFFRKKFFWPIYLKL